MNKKNQQNKINTDIQAHNERTILDRLFNQLNSQCNAHNQFPVVFGVSRETLILLDSIWCRCCERLFVAANWLIAHIHMRRCWMIYLMGALPIIWQTNLQQYIAIIIEYWPPTVNVNHYQHSFWFGAVLIYWSCIRSMAPLNIHKKEIFVFAFTMNLNESHCILVEWTKITFQGENHIKCMHTSISRRNIISMKYWLKWRLFLPSSHFTNCSFNLSSVEPSTALIYLSDLCLNLVGAQ